jgi:hypothetical protein
MSMVFKQCVICKAEKDTTNFHKKQHGKYGVSSRCKPCDYEYSKKYWKESSRIYREKNREKIRANSRTIYLANPEKANEATKKSRTKHYDRYITYSRNYELENKEARLLKSRMYAKNNPHKVAAISSKRRTKQKNATPIWSNIEMTKRIYKLRDRLNTLAGHIKYHVDHVIPLNAKLASGLHVPNNLKIELASVNMSKRNTFEGIEL